MKKVLIKGERITNAEEFHKVVAEIFDFPDYYGENLNAFWDCIVDWGLYYQKEKVIIEWQNHEVCLDKKLIKEIENMIKELSEKYNLDISLVLK